MSVAIVSYNKFSKTSTLAHNKITNAIKKLCPNAVILDSDRMFYDNKDKKFDRVFVVNGMECFCDYRDYIPQFVENNKKAKLYWCSNDYAMRPSKKMSQLLIDNGATLLSTVVEDLYSNKWFTNYKYVNFNLLTYNPNFDYKLIDKNEDLIYYGAFRDGRVKDFKKYFSDIKLHISTTDRNKDKFLEVCKKATVIDTFSFKDSISFELAKFRFSLYIEDEKSHDFYCSPANRFYECLSNGVFMLFDSSCKFTFDTAKIDISDFVVSNVDELRDKMEMVKKDFYTYEDKQRNIIDKNSIKTLENEISNIIYDGNVVENDNKNVSYW